MNTKILACTLALATLPALSHAAGDAAAGAAKSAVCSACHGQGGAQPIMPTYPRLAGQSEGYIEYAIKTYKSQERKGAQAALMYPMVQNLTDQDIADLAAYFSTQQ